MEMSVNLPGLQQFELSDLKTNLLSQELETTCK